jgi:hypothetical protein
VLDSLTRVNGRRMKTSEKRPARSAEMREHYDFAAGERGKYVNRLKAGSNVVVLEPDVARQFKTSQAVNDALRSYLRSASPRRRRAT